MHLSVLADEVISGLALKEGGTYVDGTAGDGGHSRRILERIGADGRLLVIDRDAKALEVARKNLAGEEERVIFKCGNYCEMRKLAAEEGISEVDGIVLDIGMSSTQLDNPERGFSFMNDGPLDMRMNQADGPTAADLVNTLDEIELTKLLRKWGEEPSAVKIARAIVEERSGDLIHSSRRLANIVARVKGGRRSKIHPATRTFQALRMEVNQEIPSLENGIEAGLHLLRKSGRMAIITFHSIEDRVVKRSFKEHEGRNESLQQGGERWVGKEPKVIRVTRKPVIPTEQEISTNPRARSAKLRIAERAA